MATKNLSRTLVEGGRISYNKRDKYFFNRSRRAENHRFSYLAQTLIDPDDLGPSPTSRRYKLSKVSSGKAGPIYRWLRKQVGKKWDRVFSVAVHQFDARTGYGYDLVRDYILGSVVLNITDVRHLAEWWGPREFFVDEVGVLQQGIRRRSRPPSLGYPHRDAQVQNWAANRRVMDYGVSIFWMVPEQIDWARCGYRLMRDMHGKLYWSTSGKCYRKHRVVTGLVKVPDFDVPRLPSSVREKLIAKIEFVVRKGIFDEVLYMEEDVRECRQGLGHYFQGSRFSESDLAMWRSLDSQRYDLLWVKQLKP